MPAPSERSPRSIRLFFALWPGELQRAALWAGAESLLARVEGRPVSPGSLHVTLAFLGMVRGRTLAQLLEVGGRSQWPAVALEFRRVEYWAKPRVVVAVASEVPAEGQAMVDQLWQGLEPLGFVREARPWRPHLTLARGVRRPPPENLALMPALPRGDANAWRLALVESAAYADGRRYKPLADWPLVPFGSSFLGWVAP